MCLLDQGHSAASPTSPSQPAAQGTLLLALCNESVQFLTAALVQIPVCTAQHHAQPHTCFQGYGSRELVWGFRHTQNTYTMHDD